MDVTILPASPADAGELLTVQRAAYLVEGERYNSFRIPPLTETLAEIRAAISGDDTVLVARAGHRLIGSVRARICAGTGHIGRLAVTPDLQGRGVGRQLLAAIEQALTGRVTRFELFTGAGSDDNLRLYRNVGYTDIGVRPSGSGPGLAYLEKIA